MRRLYILFYWFFKARNNVGFFELIRFCLKPTVTSVARKYVTGIREAEDDFEIFFRDTPNTLYWPKECPIAGIYQVTSETFDRHDWHFYQKAHTEVAQGEVLLDLGAAEGLFALTVVDRCERILMVEPNDFFVKALRKTFQHFADKVEIFNVAVGSHDGEIAFDQNSLSGHIAETTSSTNKKKMVMVDHLLDSKARITYLKADLEGFELEMLKGAENVIKRNKPKIAITTYHNENKAVEIIALIKKFVPEYNFYVKGVTHFEGKPVMIHFWIN